MKQLGKFFLLAAIFISPIAYVDFFTTNEFVNASYAALDADTGISEQSSTPPKSSPKVIEIEGRCTLNSPGSWFAGCLTDKIIYLSGILFVLGATVFDFFLQLTLSNGILEQPYISTAWASMRDLANITFIFGIIAVAFMMITGAMGNWRKVAWKLIIVALLLNFSLFFTRVVIDAGNILGGFFYNQIIAGAPSAYVKGVNGEDVKSPGAKLISGLSVDQIIGETAITEMTKGSSSTNSFWFTFNIAVLAMSFLMAKSLFKVGFFMLSRTVWLVIYSIISPLAFVAYFIPSVGSYARDWFQGLVSKSFCVCAYLFILYITFILVDGITLGSSAYVGDGNATWINLLIQMAITVGLVSTLMDKGTSIAQSMCEGGSGGIGSMVMKTTMGAAALVGGGVVGRAGLGRLGHHMANNAGDWAGSDNMVKRNLGNLGLYAGDKFENAKFGMDKGYKDKLTSEGAERKNTFDRIYNQTQSAQEKKIIKGGDEKYVRDGKLTSAGRALAKENADKAGQGYLDRIQKSPMDWVLAGGVPAGREGAAKVKEAKDADAKAKEKTAKLRNQQMAIERDRNYRDSLMSGTTEDLSKLFASLTGQLQPATVMGSSQMDSMQDLLKKTHMTIQDHRDDGTPVFELSDEGKLSFERTWDQVTEKIADILESGNTALGTLGQKATTLRQEKEQVITDTTKENDFAVANDIETSSLVDKFIKAESKGSIEFADLSKAQQEMAKDLGLEMDGDSVKYSALGLDKLRYAQNDTRTARRDTESKLKQARKDLEDTVKELEREEREIEQTRDKELQKIVSTVEKLGKANNKSIADTEKATLNARVENITEERTILQKELEDGTKLTYEKDPFSTDSDVL